MKIGWSQMVTNEINEEVYTNVLYSRVRVIHRKLKLYTDVAYMHNE